MTFQTAVTSPQLTKLRSSSYSADYLMKLCANRVVLAGQLNGALSGDWAQFNYDTVTTGAYTNVVTGQAFLVSATNNIQTARYRGRIRKTPTSTILYTNESSAVLADNSYFWVIDTHDAQYRLSRPDVNGTELIDCDETYHGLRPSITGLQTVYFNYDPTGGKFRIAFAVSAIAKQSGNTISSYQFTFTAGTYTVISGSLASATVTVDFNPGEQWGQLVVTDSGGVTATRYFLIEACDDTVNPPDFGFDAPPISCELGRGWSLSVGAFTGIDNILNNTFVVVARANEQFSGVAGSLFTNNIAFCGWLQRESDPATADTQYSVIETATLEFNGIGAALARLNSQLVPFFINAAPSQAEQVLQLTPWRAVGKFIDDYTTIGTLCDLAFDDTTDTFLFPTITTQGGNALTVIQGIAQMVASVIEFAPDGRIQMVKDATYQSSSERAADVTIAALTTQDFVNTLTRSQEENPNYGITDTDGAYYNLTNGRVVGFTARAPGIARGEAEGNDNLPSQILAASSDDATALAELIQRATNRFNFINNNEYLDAEFVDGWNFLIPSRQQLYTITASALTANGVNRINYDTSTTWLLESFSIARGNNGETVPRGRFHRLQDIGTGGINTTLIAPGAVDFSVPDLGVPSFPDIQLPEIGVSDAGGTVPLSATVTNPTVADATGQIVVAKNNTDAFIERNFINLTTPQSTMVTPSDLGSFQIKQVLFDPFSPNNALGCYLLASDGTDSAVWYTTNVLGKPPIWAKGATVTGIYTILRTTNVSGGIMISAPSLSAGSSTQTYNFPTNNSGFTTISLHADDPAHTYTPDFIGQYLAGTGWQNSETVSSGNTRFSGIHLHLIYGSAQTITAVSISFDRTTGTNLGDLEVRIEGRLATVSQFSQSHQPGATGTNQTDSWSGSASIDELIIVENNGECNPDPCTPGGSATFKSASITSTSAGGATVRYSSSYGIFWGGELLATTSPGSVGGFDTQRSGANSFAAAGGKVYRATALGSSYSAYYTITGGVEAACIIVPYFNWSGAKQTAAANPDIIVGLTGADGSGRTLLWIEGGATPGTVHDLTPVANYVFDNPNAITVSYNHHIACMGKVSGVYTLRTTTDKGTTWISRGTLTSPNFIRTRRGDTTGQTSGTNKGQLYTAQNNVIEYSSKWGADGVNWPRTQPATGINGFDIWSS